MRATPSSSAKKGEVVLQPAFFTSSLFVNPFRDDIAALSQAYADAWGLRAIEGRPFAVFKDVWNEFGWPWLHLKTLEDRSRDCFLEVVMRLFLGALAFSITLSEDLSHHVLQSARPSRSHR
jgi:hypothetical protein